MSVLTMCATCPAHIIPVDLITLIIIFIFHPPVSSFCLGPNILLNILFHTPSLLLCSVSIQLGDYVLFMRMRRYLAVP